MNILCYSSVFAPSIGGIETFVEAFCIELTKKGHNVHLITTSPNTQKNDFIFSIYRNPSIHTEIKLIRAAEIILHNCIWLKKTFLPLLLHQHNFVIHHTWYRDNKTQRIRLIDLFKKNIARFYVNISISKAIQKSIPCKSYVIHNFTRYVTSKSNLKKEKDLVFVGRLVSDKGCNLLIEAIEYLKIKYKKNVSATIIGNGSEYNSLKKSVSDKKLTSIEFAGILRNQELYNAIQQHRFIVIPSIWEEPFGIVALEGINAGCIPIVANRGGLPEAIGDCGLTFESNNYIDLSTKIFDNLNCDLSIYQQHFDKHIENHSISFITDQYLNLFNKIYD